MNGRNIGTPRVTDHHPDRAGGYVGDIITTAGAVVDAVPPAAGYPAFEPIELRAKDGEVQQRDPVLFQNSA